MKRRTFLASAGTAAAASTLPAPAIAQGIRELKLVSSFPVFPAIRLLADTITELSEGRLRVKAFGAGELVGSFEVFDAVSEGVADMYWSSEHYWQDRSAAFAFFTTVPFGLTPAEAAAWIHLGGGQQLWDELSANFNLKPFHVGNSSVQMGGWYKEKISSIKDYEGLRIRIPALGGEVMRRLGAIVVNLPPNDIVPAMKSGALDAAEWVGPIDDFGLGFHTAAKNYYYPGFHEPGAVQAFAINKKLWDSLTSVEQNLIETVLARTAAFDHADLHVSNMSTLAALLEKHGVQLHKFDDEILRTFGKVSGEVVAEVGASDPFTRRVYDSYMKFRRTTIIWTDISQRAYLNARALDFPYGN